MTTTEADAEALSAPDPHTPAAPEQQEHPEQPKHPAGTVHGYHEQKAEHLKRLRRIEGQIRGLQRMVDEDTYCIDILTQVSASTKALQSFALQLLEEHLRHCVADAALKGGDEIDEKVEEATRAIARLLRT
ncbi:metal-sensitive transcriptional regulator [Streptomyces sp. NBC_00199]|uniref:metal-sensitive transcriptional regulator n=1 Tax=Streptomyces sp. NBC_00199 TaxID=2975678 RepID=UPI002255CA09|nr:metal-sensitive transcriptional regulator [Streptomyces sp. NBC_00199]MCX5265046.1 metal-sensitive transcriptional regulator [Streptomyces sp. NBC_00199]